MSKPTQWSLWLKMAYDQNADLEGVATSLQTLRDYLVSKMPECEERDQAEKWLRTAEENVTEVQQDLMTARHAVKDKTGADEQDVW